MRSGEVYDDSAHNSDEDPGDDADADEDAADADDRGADGGGDRAGDHGGAYNDGGDADGGGETSSGDRVDDIKDVPASTDVTGSSGGGVDVDGGGGWVYSFNVGVEAEAAGRSPTKSFQELRRDLAALPWVLAGSNDVVLAPRQRPEFLDTLRAAGVTNLPEFEPQLSRERRETIEGYRPYGVAGSHLRRSAVARYRDDVTVCHTLDDVRAAIALHGGLHGGGVRGRRRGGGRGKMIGNGKVVLKSEFSSSGLGVRVYAVDAAAAPARAPAARHPAAAAAEEGVARQPTTPPPPITLEDGSADERWVTNCLRRDGSLTVEPWYNLAAEVTAEWLDGRFIGVSQCIVRDMRWEGQWLGDDPTEGGMDAEVADFVFGEDGRVGGVERALEALRVPETCGTATCGVDVAIVREEEEEYEEARDGDETGTTHADAAIAASTAGHRYRARVMELNARTTMSHYAMAVKRRFSSSHSPPSASRRTAPHRATAADDDVAEAGDEDDVRVGERREPRRFVVVRVSELGDLGDDVVCLTDPVTATAFVACVVF